MTDRNSTAVARPNKPHKDFPLFWHKTGYWCKKIRGVRHRFGARHCDPKEALDEWLRVKDDLLAGREPRPHQSGPTIADLCNSFLTDRKQRVDAGEITERTFLDYFKNCKRVIEYFGKHRFVDDIRIQDFSEFRASMAKEWGPVTLGNEIQRVRTLFKFAYEADLVASPVRFGPTFKKPSKRVMRIERSKKGEMMFEPQEIIDLLAIASAQLRAMILLGINCGFGNNDCAQLPIESLDLAGGWIDFYRPKTGIRRRCKLWPETVDALKTVIDKRTDSTRLVFLTKYGNPWVHGNTNGVTLQFGKLVNQLGIKKPGRGFYTLRHCFETIAGESKDQVAVDSVMGHARDDMASVYRERISDERLEEIATVVHQWLFTTEGKS